MTSSLLLLFRNRAGGSAPTITVLPSIADGYASVMGTSRLISGYTGNLYTIIRTSDNATLDISQDANGRADVSGVAAWAAGSPTYVKGHFNQVTGNYVDQGTAGKRPLLRLSNSEGDNYPLTFGYNDTGSLSLSMGLPSEGISVNRNNVGMFVVCRTLGGGIALQHASLNSATPVGILGVHTMPSNKYTLYTFGSTNGFTLTAPPTNKLGVLGYVGTASNSLLHVNNRVTTEAANSSSVAALSYLGRNTTSTTSSSLMDATAQVVTNTAPTTTESSAIKDALYSIFSVSTVRNNVMVCCPHSLTFCANGQVYNNTCWKQMTPLLTKQVETNLVAQSGKKMSTQLAEQASLINIYEASADRYIYYFGSAVNDINGLASGFGGGIPANIQAAALTIYNDAYKALMVVLKAQGSNVRIIIATGWKPSSGFWGGTTQDKLDKAECLTYFNQLLRDNYITDGFLVSDEETVNTTGSFSSGDTIHFNETGEGRRAAIQAPIVDSLLV